MEQHLRPKGALTFMLVYLVALSFFWVNSFFAMDPGIEQGWKATSLETGARARDTSTS